MADILVLNGPNLNLLGRREVSIYGSQSLADIEAALTQAAQVLAVSLHCFQSQAEHALIERIHAAQARDQVRYIIFNPGAFTHTSVALRDALLGTEIPFVEVHLSNPYRREPFRHTSYFSDIAEAVVLGLGAEGYQVGLRFAAQKLHAAD